MIAQAPMVDAELDGVPEAERAGRWKVLREAVSWLGTKYHHSGHVKGAGVDCAHLLIEVYHAAGIAPRVDPGFYRSGLAYLRRGERMYLDIINQLAYRANAERRPKPADIVVFRFVHATHGAIVLQWPIVLHAYLPAGAVVVSDVDRDRSLTRRVDSVWIPGEWS